MKNLDKETKNVIQRLAKTIDKVKDKKEQKGESRFAINYIPFMEFMKIHNFRDTHNSSKGNDYENDTKIVRIYYGGITDNNPFRDKSEWFEFGIYDFGSTRQLIQGLNKILSKEIIDSYVDSFCVNDETGILEIWITSDAGDLYDD